MSAIKLLSSTRIRSGQLFRCEPFQDNIIHHDCSEYFSILSDNIRIDVCNEHLPNGAWESVRMYHYIGTTYWSCEIFNELHLPSGETHDFVKAKI